MASASTPPRSGDDDDGPDLEPWERGDDDDHYGEDDDDPWADEDRWAN